LLTQCGAEQGEKGQGLLSELLPALTAIGYLKKEQLIVSFLTNTLTAC
jgi:hypothetical protein